MFIFLFWFDDTIFSTLNTNLNKFKLKKLVNVNFQAILTIDYNFEELYVF